MTTTITESGLLEIPEVYRKADSLFPGQRCDIERVGYGEYRLRVENCNAVDSPAEKLIDVLLSCPVKDWWSEPDRGDRSMESSSLFGE